MNEIVTTNNMLPETLPELSRFVLIGREKLNAVRAEIRAIEKVGLAKEVLEQKKVEAQEIAELVTMSEMQIGRMMKEIPKATANQYTSANCPEGQKAKSETIRELGFTPKQTAQFQQMADHEPQVLEAIAEAREHDDIVSRAAVMRKIEEKKASEICGNYSFEDDDGTTVIDAYGNVVDKLPKKKPHVSNNSGDNEWYTPAEYIEAARAVMGSIDLDPASNEWANKTVKAPIYYTEETNGLDKEWFGNVWLNPPYSASLVSQFAEKLVQSSFDQAVVLVNNATDTAWFKTLIEHARAIIFTTGRVRFIKRDGQKGAPLQGQAFIYFGDNPEKFLDVFKRFGWGCNL